MDSIFKTTIIMKQRHDFLHILATLACAFCFAACTPEDIIDIFTDDDQETPATPSDPTDDKNTVTVTSNGALVTHGDISINFPKGTFTNDSKVTVTEEKKGAHGGKYEASTFYKVTMPATANKNLTVRVKSDNLGDDVNYVMLSTGYAPSLQKEVPIECYPETTYSNGEYVATIPPTADIDDPGSLSFTIGLGHIPTLNNSEVKSTRGLSNLNWALESGEVDGVKWDIYMGWEAWALYNSGTLGQMKSFAPELNKCIKEAVHEIYQLGFRLNGDHSIPFYFSKTENWGEHVQHWANNNLWSCLYISIPKILEANCNMTKELKMTVIHETLHYFQSDYDPRYFSILKQGDNDHLALAEMGSVWIEKFTNGGQLSASFQLEPNGVGTTMDPVNKYRLGLSRNKGDISKLFPTDKAYAEYGYSLGPLLHYLTTYGGSYGITDKSVSEIYNKWGKLDNLLKGYTTLDLLNDWTQSHNWNFFDGGNSIDDYYLKLWKGEIVKGLSFVTDRAAFINFNNEMGTKKLPKGSVWPYGCEGITGTIKGFNGVSMKDKELVVRQDASDLQTYLLLANSAEKSKVTRITQFPQKAIVISENYIDSIVVSGEELEKYRTSDGTMDMGFFLLTTRQANYPSITGSKPSNVVVELRKAKGTTPSVAPTSLSFSAEGEIKTVKVEPAGYKYYGATVRNEGKGWCSVNVPGGCIVQISTQPNTSLEARECIVDCWVTNDPNYLTAEDKVKMPVKIVQDGATPPGGESDIIVTGMHESAYAMMVTIKVKEQMVGDDDIIDLDRVFILDEEEITFNQNGSTLHLSTNENGKTFSCDILNLTGDCSNTKAVNAKYTKSYDRGNGEKGSETITFGEIPLHYSYFPSYDSYGTLIYRLYEADGLKITSYTNTQISKNYIGEGFTTYTYKYVPDPDNMIEIDFNFDYQPNDAGYAPRYVPLSTTLPWQTGAAVR